MSSESATGRANGDTRPEEDLEPVSGAEPPTADEPAEEIPRGADTAKRRRPGGAAIAGTLVVLLLLGGLAFTGWRWHQRSTEDAARAEALAAGREYALSLTTYDHQDLAGNFDRVARHSSPAFARQYQEVSAGLTQLIQQYQATSKGEVLHAGVAESSPDRAVLLLFVDQSITNTNSPEPRVDRTRMRLTLVHPGDQWLIDDVQLI
ncbi:VirB8/TrbF family protein [Saccharopolyspora sp. NPDC047091]|uniref:VirB8/TrbF family protein n=1 Tax=Saccharopolyspora sp. NPDC047091 TaxID=3155924 RepID=UPI0033DECC7D